MDARVGPALVFPFLDAAVARPEQLRVRADEFLSILDGLHSDAMLGAKLCRPCMAGDSFEDVWIERFEADLRIVVGHLGTPSCRMTANFRFQRQAERGAPVSSDAMKTMPVDEFPLLGEVLAVEFANSHYIGDGEDLDFLTGHVVAEAWFAHAEAARHLTVPARLAPRTLASLRRIRDAARGALVEVADAGGRLDLGSPAWRCAADVLHSEARRAPSHLALDLEDGEPTWRLHHSGQDPQVLVAAVASQCILFLGGDQVTRVRRCERPACPMLFVRQHRARRFCTESCAHSVRQAHYYRRSREAVLQQARPRTDRDR